MGARRLTAVTALVTLASCGGGGSSDGGPVKPSYETVKPIVLKSPPLTECFSGRTSAGPLTKVKKGDFGREGVEEVALMGCDPPKGPQATYEVFESEDALAKRVKRDALDSNADPYFTNGRVLVNLTDPAPNHTPSPIAQQIKDACDCGEVHEAGKPLPQPTG